MRLGPLQEAPGYHGGALGMSSMTGCARAKPHQVLREGSGSDQAKMIGDLTFATSRLVAA